MGIVCAALTRAAIGVGTVVGAAIRVGHGDVGRSEPKPSIETATPVRGIPAVDPATYPRIPVVTVGALEDDRLPSVPTALAVGYSGPAVTGAARMKVV